MQFRLIHLIYICACVAAFMLPSCGHDVPAPSPSPGLVGDSLDRTLIVYMAGENSLADFVGGDSLELAEGLEQLDSRSRLVVFIDDTRSSRLCVGMKGTPLQRVSTFEANIASTEVHQMHDVLSHIVRTYPARHFGLVFWSHASGWVFQDEESRGRLSAARRTFGIDNGRRSKSNTGLEMNIPELRRVLEQLPHFDYLFFDACFMQEVEVAYELRSVADFVVGSPAEIPGDGAPYATVLADLCAVPSRLDDLVRHYTDYYVSGPGKGRYAGAELSVVQTDQLADLAAATRPLVGQLFGQRSTPQTDDVQRYVPANRWSVFTDGFDLQHLFYTRCDPSSYAAWAEVLGRAVPFKSLTPQWTTAFLWNSMALTDADHCAGLSMFVPDERYAELGWLDHYSQLQWYADAGFNQTGW